MSDEQSKRDRLQLVRKHLKVFTEEAAELESELGLENDNGRPAGTDIATKLRTEKAGATLFEKMTSAERMQLAREDPDRFHEILEQYRQAGMRKLFGGAL